MKSLISGKKIAMVTTWDESCGIADYAEALVDAFSTDLKIEVLSLDERKMNAAYYKNLALKCNAFDLVHIQHEYVFFGGRAPWNNYWKVFLNYLTVPYVVTVHTRLRPFKGGGLLKRFLKACRDTYFNLSGWTAYIEAGQFKNAEKIIVHSHAFAKALAEKGIDAQQIMVLPQGVPHVPGGLAERAKNQWRLYNKVVTIFGFLLPSKGHDVAIQAWDKVDDDIQLVVAGGEHPNCPEPEYNASVKQLAQSHGNRIIQTGYLSDQELADLLAASTIVLLPYQSGTSSYSLSVCLSHQKPVLASTLDYFKEMAQESNCIQLVETKKSTELARKVNTLVNDREEQEKLRQAAAEWAHTHSWQAVANNIIALYQQLLK